MTVVGRFRRQRRPVRARQVGQHPGEEEIAGTGKGPEQEEEEAPARRRRDDRDPDHSRDPGRPPRSQTPASQLYSRGPGAHLEGDLQGEDL